MIRERTGGKAAERYATMVGKNVIIYYRDMRDTDRKLYGVITEIAGDVIHMQNGEWCGILDCRHARILLVSTIDGWNTAEMEDKAERHWYDKLFRR